MLTMTTSSQRGVMSCEIHQRIEGYLVQERDLILRLRLTRTRRRHLEESLAYLAEPLGSDFPELVVRAADEVVDEEGLGEADPEPAEDAPTERFGQERIYQSVALSLAQQHDWRVRVADVAREIKKRNLSEAKHASLYATVHKVLSKSENWEKSDDGEFEYINGVMVGPLVL